ncbi:MAG: PilZ domain-containing protein [Burkholderiales bacterium]|jgi:type IV pilus assembly protein PilZ|nr:PilZ domain-containing protein [Burkholderiales bacterium]
MSEDFSEQDSILSVADEVPATTAAQAASPLGGVLLPINVRERAALYASYMSFVRGGGFFVPTSKPFSMGDEVFLLININIPAHQIDEKLQARGKVVWITPESVRPGRLRGIGVQFADDKEGMRAQTVIEGILGKHLGSVRETHTL